MNSDSQDTTLRFDQPYPGLRPFTNNEAELFHGRAQHVIGMLRRLEKARFSCRRWR